ncbi:AAA family ATPase [Microbacterium sp. M3]|uniref:AAA family ATPase n=1 Tax=Microbacterium arthrosphaerae TaxID=792652 RepID=A0ABU4H4V1_9MICO|nr:MULTISPECIES: AAA family ATPase [Microbacterium]MDW4572899.1 AAA family ATPase [Microbacterium arthrosphaerae]MDW7606754.1 AAA family ATPase [Microbacterium sp. M3]
MHTTTRHAAVTPARHSVFLGRDLELARLAEARAADSGRFFLVLGEGGIGKTTLLAAAVAQLPADRTVLRAAADEMNRRRSHGLLLEALAPLLGDDDRRLAARQNEHAIGERLLSVIDVAAAEPTVIVLEDLQWADAASLGLLARLSRTLEQLPLVILGSMRTQASHDASAELDHLLSVLSERGRLVAVELGPLPPRTCLTITERMTGGRVGAVLERYVGAAGGNPLFLTEMIRALQRDGAVSISADGEALLDAPAGPSPSLGMVMMRHLSHLSTPTRELLTTAALLGTRFDVAQLRMVADQPMSALVPLLRESFAAGFLEEAEPGILGFRHELIQAVLLHDLPAAVRGELHREIAIRLESAHVAPATVAAHLLQAPASPEDLEWMLGLAQSTSAIAPATAEELWERVAATSAPGDPAHLQALAGLARAALSAGRAAQSSALAESALQHDVGPDLLPSLTATYTHALMQEHRNHAARDEAERYAASLVLEPGDRAAHLAFAGWPRFMLGDLRGAERLAGEGAAMASAAGNHGAEVLALTLRGQIADLRGDLDDAIAHLTRATELADRYASFATIESFPHALLALALADAGRTTDLLDLLQRGLQMSEVLGYRTGVLAAHAFGAQVRSHLGNLTDISAELDAHRDLVGSMDVRMSGPVHGLRACVVSHQHGAEAAREWAALLDPLPDRARWAGRGRSWIWRGLSRPHRSDRGDAEVFAVLSRGWQELRDADMLMDCAEVALDLVDAAGMMTDAAPPARAAARDRAHEVVDVLTDLADRNPGVSHLRATALAAEGRATGGADLLVEATLMLADGPRRLDHARIAELAAQALPASSDERRALAEASLRSYSDVGADHDVIRARSVFRRAGIPIRNQPRTRPTYGWEALTRTEERVARHVATGATNPEIAQSLSVSRRTVETHVSNVLGKLGLRSRTELALFIARRSDDPRQHG